MAITVDGFSLEGFGVVMLGRSVGVKVEYNVVRSFETVPVVVIIGCG